MISTVLVYWALTNPATRYGLQYGDNLDIALLACNLPTQELEPLLESNFRQIQAGNPTQDQILKFAALYSASWLFLAQKLSSPNKAQMKEWLRKNLVILKDGAEKESLKYLFSGGNYTRNPSDFSEHSVRESSMVAFVVASLRGSRFCQNEEDLRTTLVAMTSARNLPFSMFHTYGHECSYYFSCYFVRKDFKALRTAINFRYKAAEFDPNPNGIQENKDWCKPWEGMLKKKGF